MQICVSVILPNLLSSFMYTDIQLALIVKHLEHFLRYVLVLKLQFYVNFEC